MGHLSFILIGVMCAVFAPTVFAMECNLGGIPISCPTIVDAKDKAFCCDSRIQNVQYCCDIEEYMKTNSGIIAGLVIAVVVVVLIITLCCCCFCSCCCLARRRVQRGHVLYGPVTGTQVVTAPTYQLVHPPPATQVHSPPPYNPNPVAGQPPLNPYYK